MRIWETLALASICDYQECFISRPNKVCIWCYLNFIKCIIRETNAAIINTVCLQRQRSPTATTMSLCGRYHGTHPSNEDTTQRDESPTVWSVDAGGCHVDESACNLCVESTLDSAIVCHTCKRCADGGNGENSSTKVRY